MGISTPTRLCRPITFYKGSEKFAGVKPIILNKNENDRFIQFSLMPEK